MTRSRSALLALGAVATLVAIGWATWRPKAPAPATVTAATISETRALPRCRPPIGTQAAFAIESTVSAGGTSDRLKTVLSWRVTAASPAGGVLVHAALSGSEHEQRLTRPEQRVNDPLDLPFVLRQDEQCRFVEKGFSNRWRANTRRLVASLLGNLELALPPESEPAAPTWQADQSDGLGEYRATYRRSEDAGALSLTKTKDFYRTSQGPQGFSLEVQIADARADGVLDPTGWLREAESREHVRLFMQKKLVADLELHLTLRRDDAAFHAPAPVQDESAIDWTPPSQVAEKIPDAPPDPALRALPLDGALARFASIYHSSQNGDAYAAARFLADWLRARPDQATEIADGVKRGKIPSSLHPAVFLGLELCGTDEARAVLGKLVADPSHSDINRARAASALSDVPKPTRESTKALMEASRASSKDQDVIAGTSVRALGHLAGRQDVLAADVSRDVHDTLQRDLDHAPTTSRTIDVIDAVGNSRDKAFLPSLEPKLTDPSSAVREHAARAMGGIPEAEPALLRALARETDPAVRLAIVGSLEHIGAHDVPALELAAAQLAAEPDAAVRAALIRWLGAAVKEPVAKSALVAQFRRETVAANLQLIGRFLPASDLSR